MHINRTGYSGQIYNPERLRGHAEFVKAALRVLEGKFDFVAATGKSGLAVAFAALAAGAKFDLVTIRKGESTHGSMVEGKASGHRYVLVDDFISSGDTARRVHEELQAYGDVEMVAAVLYSADNYISKKPTWKLDGQDAPVVIFGESGL